MEPAMSLVSKSIVLAALFACAGAASAQKSTLVARGKYLAEGVVACGNCHTPRDDKGQLQRDKGLSGGLLLDIAPFKAYAANLTPDAETGIGKWTDGQLAKAVREGIRPDKSLIGPPMPIEHYRHLADDDLAAIIAYLRAQPAVKNAVPRSTYRIPLPPNYGPPVGKVKAPSPRDKLGYGKYLADIGHCMDCHTPRNEQGELVLAQLGAGGQVIEGPWGTTVSRNLTPTGLKDWTDAQIARAIRDGVDRNGQPYRPPMAYTFYKNINDADMGALIAYLRSLKPQAPTAKN
jgi:mono/diheme cytochrome c family protein